MVTLRGSHAFICVDVLFDGKKAGGNGTFMRVAIETTTCKELLDLFLQNHAAEYSPLLVATNVVLMCVKISDTVQGMPAADVGSLQECSVFLDYLVDMAMTEVPTKRFMFRCSRPIEERRPRQDPIIVMMAQRSSWFVHLPPLRDKSST